MQVKDPNANHFTPLDTLKEDEESKVDEDFQPDGFFSSSDSKDSDVGSSEVIPNEEVSLS